MGARSRGVREWRTGNFGPGVRVYVTPHDFTVLFTSRRGFVYRSVHLPFLSVGAESQKQEVADAVWEVRNVKKKDRKKLPGGGFHAGPELLGKHYPNLAEWLTTAAYEDGEKREAPTITLWCGGGLWRATLKDRAEGLVMWLSAEKLLELMMLAEQYCMEEEGPWRHDDYSDNHGKRKRSLK